MKAHCALRSVLDFRRFSGVGEGSQPRHSGGNLVFPLRNAAKYKVIPGGQSGRKNSAQLFHRFMCLRIVSALRPWAISDLAICWEIPHVGHLRATQPKRPVLFLPADMQIVRFQLARFTPGILGGIPGIACDRRIHQLPNRSTVHGIALCSVPHKLGQWHRILPGHQFQCAVRS